MLGAIKMYGKEGGGLYTCFISKSLGLKKSGKSFGNKKVYIATKKLLQKFISTFVGGKCLCDTIISTFVSGKGSNGNTSIFVGETCSYSNISTFVTGFKLHQFYIYSYK